MHTSQLMMTVSDRARALVTGTREAHMETVISAAGPTKRYGAVVALDGLDLEVPPACVVGYLGPNGAGKTTTIRLLVGLLRPTAGTARVVGFDSVREEVRCHERGRG
jgi:ABC-2 type transport system ATP-binding protein